MRDYSNCSDREHGSQEGALQGLHCTHLRQAALAALWKRRCMASGLDLETLDKQSVDNLLGIDRAR